MLTLKIVILVLCLFVFASKLKFKGNFKAGCLVILLFKIIPLIIAVSLCINIIKSFKL